MANTVTDALTKLFLALGGDPTKLYDDHNLTDYLDDLGDALVEAVKAELPAVTSTDNGDVLSVVNGKWAKAKPQSGGETFLVEITWTTSNTGTATKNATEILSALNDGKNVILKNTPKDTSDIDYAQLLGVTNMNSTIYASFAFLYGYESSGESLVYGSVVSIAANGEATMAEVRLSY